MKIYKGYGISLSRLHAVAVVTVVLMTLFVGFLHGTLGLSIGDAIAVAFFGWVIGVIGVLVGFAEIDDEGDVL